MASDLAGSCEHWTKPSHLIKGRDYLSVSFPQKILGRAGVLTSGLYPFYQIQSLIQG